MNFERYYTHPNFDKLGFSPYRENEVVYNQNSSWWDDFNRMRHQWGSLFWNGVKSAGIGDLFGDADESAEAMEKAMAIGSSSKEGAGAFITNLTLNSAYTMGIMAELAVESVALAALETASFGTATPIVAAEAGRMGYSATKAIKGMWNFVKSMKEINKAREVYYGAKAAGLGKKVLNFVNPLENTVEFATHLAKGTNSFKELNGLAKTTLGFGAFYKDVRGLALAHSEASMEGASGAHQYHQKLIDEYYAENGFMPEGQAAEDIYRKSQSLRTGVTLANDFVIYATNKITFDKLLKGFPNASQTSKAIIEGADETFTKVAGKEIATKGALELTEPTFKKKAFDFLVSSQYVPWSRAYMAGNVSEALQENLQDLVQDYQLNRHQTLAKDPSQAGFWNAINQVGGSLGKQWSGQGLETFMSGFLMGSIAGGTQGAIVKGFEKGRSLVDKNYAKTIEDAQQARSERSASIANAVNSLATTGINIGKQNSTRFAAVKKNSDAMDKAANQGNEYTFQNHKTELEFEHLLTLAGSKKMNLYSEAIDDQLNLSDEDLANAYNVKVNQVSQVRDRLQKRKKIAETFNQQYEDLHSTFENPHNPSMFNPEKQPELYKQVKADYDAHNASLDLLLYSMTSSQRIGERKVALYEELTGVTPWLYATKGPNVIKDAGAEQVTLLLDSLQRETEISALREEIEVLEKGTPEQKKQAKEKREDLELLEQFNSDLRYFNTEITGNKRELTEEEKAKAIKVSKVREGAVVKEGEKEGEYTVTSVRGDQVTVKDKDGKTKTLNRYNLDIVKESTKSSPFAEGDTLDEALAYLKDSFYRYARNVAKRKGGRVLESNLRKTFTKLKDFYLLERDSQAMVSAINTLTNPYYLRRYSAIQSKINGILSEREADDIKDAFEKLEELKLDNDFLNKLFDIGVWIMPEDVEKFKTKPRDVTYYDLLGKSFIAPSKKQLVPKDSEKYKKILEIIEAYEKEKGLVPTGGKPAGEKGKSTTLTDKQREEKARARNAAGRRQKTAPEKFKRGLGATELYRLDGDNRVLEDLEEYYALKDKGSSVNVKEHVQKIIDNDFTNPYIKDILKKLLPYLPADGTVVFDSSIQERGAAGVYYPGNNQIAMDPLAHEGKTGYYEGVFLHELIHMLTVNEMYNDPNGVFATKIKELYNYTIDTLSKSGRPVDYYGFKNELEFLSEAYSNPEFQKELQNVKPKGGKSLWKEFIDALANFFKTKLNVTIRPSVLDDIFNATERMINNEVYNEAVAALKKAGLTQEEINRYSKGEIINMAVEEKLIDVSKKGAISEEKKVTPATSTQAPLTPLTPLAEIMKFTVLKDNLIQGYKDTTGSKETSAAIIANPEFGNWIKTSGSAVNIINKYNQSTGRSPKVEEVVETKEEVEVKPEGKTPQNGIGGVEFTIPGVKLEGFEIDGYYYNVVSVSKRAMTLVDINGVIIPFYLTSGLDGKGLAPGWYPFFGFGKDGWLNKTGKADMESYYERLMGPENASILANIAQELNAAYGTDPEVYAKPDSDPTTTSRPISTFGEKVEDYVNAAIDVTPTSDDTPTTLIKFEANVTEIAGRLTDARSKQPEVEEEIITEAPVSTDAKADIERKKSLSQTLIGYVWDRLAKQGINNADDIIGTTDTIDNIDFDKFWSNVTKEDLQNLKNSYETQKQNQLDLYNKFKGAFDPSTGTITSSDTSFFDNKIKNIDAELAALEGKALAQVPLTITSQVRQQLYDLGYSKADVDSMKPADAQSIISKQTTKPVKKETGLPEFINEKDLADIETEEQLDDYLAGIYANESIRNKYKLTPKYMEDLSAKLADMLLNISKFESVNVDDVLEDSKGRVLIVKNKTKDKIDVALLDLNNLSESEQMESITKNDFDKMIKTISTKAEVEKAEVKEPSMEEKKESEELINTLSDIDSEENIQKQYEEDKNKSSVEFDDDITNLINKC
jgi:hypothetical protein